ncbi:MAG: SDR family oxidoreductase [Parvularculales bacterium]
MTLQDNPAIFITGAATGIGRATAQLFSKEGWFTGLYDIDGTGLEQLSDKLGVDKCHTQPLDVTDNDEFNEAINNFSVHTGGRMDVLFNNAGILHIGPFDTVSLDKQLATIDVNVKGVVIGIHNSLACLRHTAQVHGSAHIVSMSSASAVYGVPDFSVYSATKFAVRAITESLSIELEKDNILVHDIMPAFVDTGMVRNQMHPSAILDQMGYSHEPDDIARLVHTAVQGDTVHHYGSKGVQTSDRLSSLLPRLARRRMQRISGY